MQAEMPSNKQKQKEIKKHLKKSFKVACLLKSCLNQKNGQLVVRMKNNFKVSGCITVYPEICVVKQ